LDAGDLYLDGMTYDHKVGLHVNYNGKHVGFTYILEPKYFIKRLGLNAKSNSNIMFTLITQLSYKILPLDFIKLWISFRGDDSIKYFYRMQNSKKNTQLLVENLIDMTPNFGLYYNKINKLIIKYSRGKSGKFNLSVKYIPPYKRFKYVISLLKKDVLFNGGLTLKVKLLNTLRLILNRSKLSFLWKFKMFLNHTLKKVVKLPAYSSKKINLN
jgi:hypothetical protein